MGAFDGITLDDVTKALSPAEWDAADMRRRIQYLRIMSLQARLQEKRDAADLVGSPRVNNILQHILPVLQQPLMEIYSAGDLGAVGGRAPTVGCHRAVAHWLARWQPHARSHPLRTHSWWRRRSSCSRPSSTLATTRGSPTRPRSSGTAAPPKSSSWCGRADVAASPFLARWVLTSVPLPRWLPLLLTS